MLRLDLQDTHGIRVEWNEVDRAVVLKGVRELSSDGDRLGDVKGSKRERVLEGGALGGLSDEAGLD